MAISNINNNLQNFTYRPTITKANTKYSNISSDIKNICNGKKVCNKNKDVESSSLRKIAAMIVASALSILLICSFSGLVGYGLYALSTSVGISKPISLALASIGGIFVGGRFNSLYIDRLGKILK